MIPRCPTCKTPMRQLGTPPRDRTPTFGCVSPYCSASVPLARATTRPATDLRDANGLVPYLERRDRFG